MRIVFRADASYVIGTGHIMRCLTLADALREKGASVEFICRELPGNMCDYIEIRNYEVHRLPYQYKKRSASINSKLNASNLNWLSPKTDAEQCKYILSWKYNVVDWVVIDHYALDEKWALQLRPFTKKIMVIDDLADRPHDCDLLLDQNFYQDLHTRYKGLVSKDCIKLLGPWYALLRPEFIEARKTLRARDGTVKQILIFFGGSDLSNETTKALDAIHLLNRPDINVDVVIGASNPNHNQIKDLCQAMPNTTFHCQVNNMAQLISQADLAIGAAGSTTWERCCLGLPALIISVANNQILIAKTINQYNLGVYIGESNYISSCLIKTELEKVISDHHFLKLLSFRSAGLVDGYGLSRVVDLMLKGVKKEG